MRETQSGRGVLACGMGAIVGAGASAVADEIRFDWPLVHLDLVGEAMQPADFDGNGAIDVAIVSAVGTKPHVAIWSGIHHPSPEVLHRIDVEEARAGSLRAVDFDGDHDADLAWVEQSWTFGNAELVVFFNDGTGRGGEVRREPLAGPGWMEVGDFDRDGDADVMIGSSDGLFIHENRGARGLVPHLLFEHPSHGLSHATIGDVDADGDLDVLALYQDSISYKTYDSEVWVLLNDGRGRFPDYVVSDVATGLWGRDMALGDLDGDGDLDLTLPAGDLEYDDNPAEMHFFENAARDGTFVQRATREFGHGDVGGQTLIDVDVDGDLDVVCAAQADRGISVIRNLGAFEFAESVAFPTSVADAADVAAGDLDGDGLPEVMAISDRDGLSVLANQSPFAGPTLEHDPLVRGESATLTVRGARSGEQVRFLYSIDGWGNSLGRPRAGGLVLDLAEPVRSAGAARADDEGVAVQKVTIGAGAPVRSVALQAVVMRGPGGSRSVKTPLVLAPVR